jgi:anti-sigma factor RsiW
MNCKQCSDLLIDYCRDELPATGKAVIVNHLLDCKSCTAELAGLQEMATLLDATEQAPVNMQKLFQALLNAELARPTYIAAQKSQTRSGWFQSLWPSRPFGAICYSFALLACGLVSGQLLPPSTLGLASGSSASGTQLQMCSVPVPAINAVL